MKGIDIFCKSQAATAIHNMNMDQHSSSTSLLGSSPAIDRFNPIITDSKRISKPLPPPPPSQPPIIPKPHNKSRKTPSKEKDPKRKINSNCGEESDIRKSGWGCVKGGEFVSPAGSSRYLLSSNKDKGLLDVLSDFEEPVLTLVPLVENSKSQCLKKDEPSSSRSPDQVVVLRVSLHCKGCERKMRKHISRMEGVTSFNIDFAAKKLTVVGDVTPLAVLASVSKVKNAQLLTPTISSPVVPPVGPIQSETKKYKPLV